MRLDDWERWLHKAVTVVRPVGRVITYLLMTVLLVCSVAIGVATGKDAADHQPVVWGTFHQESCKPAARAGCTPVGTWVSDDGVIVRDQIQLDGVPEPDGTARANYQPSGLMSDSDLNIVHTAQGTELKLWLPWALAAWIVWSTVRYTVRSRSRARRGTRRR